MNGNTLFKFAMILSILWVAQCDRDRKRIIIEPPGAYIGGTVTDAFNDLPLAEALVSLDSTFDSSDVLTGSSGQYVMFTGTPEINGMAYCWKEGYLMGSKRYSTASDETTLVDFELITQW